MGLFLDDAMRASVREPEQTDFCFSAAACASRGWVQVVSTCARGLVLSATDRDAARRHQRFGLRHRVLAVVEDARREHGIGAADLDALGEVLERAHAARPDRAHNLVAADE